MAGGAGLDLGLDVGTQGTKGLVVDVEAGEVVARAERSYGLIEGLPRGAAEQDPETWMEAVRAVVRALVAQLEEMRQGGAASVRAIGVSAQQHGLVALDEGDAVIRPAKLWCDTSAAEEAAELSRAFARHVPSGFTAPKILWMKRHEPERFARLRTVLLPHDYVNFRLCARKTSEAGDASGTALFDPLRRVFDSELAARIDPALPAMLPELLEPGAPAGRLSPHAAAELGLSAGIVVAAGGGDNMMSAIGSGATRPGIAVLSLGTSATIFCYSSDPVVDPEGRIAPFCDSTGGWLPLLCQMNATGVSEEVRAAFGATSPGALASLTEEAGRVSPGSGGLLLLPYLVGERVPDLPGATGSLLGLRPGLLRAPILFRAALEGTSLNLGLGVLRMRELGLGIETVRLVGGGSRNPLWRSILADVLEAPVRCLEEPESAALGAALQACWCRRLEAGERVSADELAGGFVRLAPTSCDPDPARVARYRELGERFREALRRIHPGCVP